MAELDYIDWRARMIVGLADAMPHEGGVVVNVRQLAERLKLIVSESWIDTLRIELEQKNWAFVDWDGDDVGLELRGEGLLEAAKLRRDLSVPKFKKKLIEANWQMWALIVTAIISVAAIIFS